nr:TrkA C-terminal domain-containing protein [Butyrivibrio sp. XBB1001]
MSQKDSWTGKKIVDIGIPKDIMIVAIQRGNETIIPRGQTVLENGDILVMCAEKIKDISPIDLKEITINEGHSWNGVAIKDLDISRQSYIFMIRRKGKALVPKGNIVIKAGDIVLLYGKHIKNEFI